MGQTVCLQIWVSIYFVKYLGKHNVVYCGLPLQCQNCEVMKVFDTAESHVNLAVGKYWCCGVQPLHIKCSSLTLVDGHCKARQYRVLTTFKWEGILWWRGHCDTG
jgi:hypothetical protein